MAESEYLDKLSVSVPDLRDYIENLRDSQQKRLWHQLTDQLEAFIKNPLVHQSVRNQSLDLEQFYFVFVKSFEQKLNQLRLVRLVIEFSRAIPNDKRIPLIEGLVALPKVVEHPEASVQGHAYLAELYIVDQRLDDAKKTLDKAKSELDTIAGADGGVYSSFHRSWAAYYKSKNDPEEFFSSALQYLGYTPLDTLSNDESLGIAFDLGIAALLGEKLYNFGELLEHPVLEKLNNSQHEWLRDVLKVFGSGDIRQWKELQKKHSNELNQQKGLVEKHASLDEKISILSLLENVFNLPNDARCLSFSKLSEVTTLPIDKVELLVMRALSLGLLKGSIDEVDQVFNVTWVQPRTLSLTQISKMKDKLHGWSENVKQALNLMENETTPELIS
eukprot:TRINITY_DN3702_c0_g1_i1.p1 TRINITY_DN3702_c0_g1~~TRINITY_DN3702_c0_g1_i1.p1  ORF type:complete len:388 (+),score=93.50 TRINITY_DN3702_c0_g1_i1:38-1201(+)